MRVHELAKQLGMTNSDLIRELERMGIAVKSHSSGLDEDAVHKAMNKLGPKASKASGLAKREEDKKDAGALKAAAGREAAKGPASKAAGAVLEEPAKVDKKRILIKRKKEDESPDDHVPASPMAEEPAAVSPVPGPSSLVAGLPAHPEGTGTPLAPPHPGEAMTPAAEPARGGVGPSPDGPLAVAVPPVVPPPPASAAPAPSAAKAASEPATPGGERKKGADGTVVVEEEQAFKEKLKKPKKPGRVRDEEALRFREDAARWQDLRAIPVHRREDRSRHSQPSAVTEITKPRKKVIKLTPGLTVKEFAELVGQRPGDTIRKLMDMGQMVTLNQPIGHDAAMLIAEGLGLKAEAAVEKPEAELLEEAASGGEDEALALRPPVVTIMGHVDHGKTSLLDAIRQTNVTAGEAGGITQHIGAYTVKVRSQQVTFLDTPGHEAFTSMRARGAKVTDIVILVVAADDGVMPQTVEAINHAVAANVPIIVAINKIDKPGANPDRVKNALAEHNLIPEAWGGQTIFVEVSAKQKTGLDHLLEMILLQSEVLELRANPSRQAKGTVIEAKLDRGRGPVATVLVQNGTLNVGDAFVVGTFSGRVRALVTDAGAKTSSAGPSVPVEVIGLPGVPTAGEPFVVVNDERVAREIAETRQQKQRTAELAAGAGRGMSLDDLFTKIKEGDVKELALVIKSDVQGSAEALSAAVEKLSTDAVGLRVIHAGVGSITETDVLLASASRAIVIGFNIRPEPKASSLAEREGVDIRLYTIIYDAIADIKAAMEGLLEPTLKERTLGRAEVRQVFSIPKAGVIGGCYVVDGTISRASSGVRVIRDHVTVYEGRLGSLRRFKDDVREVQQGYECGIGVENFGDIKVGDILEVFVIDKVPAKL